MDKNVLWHGETTGRAVVEALQSNRFAATYASTKAEAVSLVMDMIQGSKTIGIGGSMTVVELGLEALFVEQGQTVYNHNRSGLTKEESLAIRRKELLADVFIASANAVTLDGQIVNTDGSGNRVAAMLFGPKKVILLVGINKVVADVEAANVRISEYAAPINAKRLNRKTPCATTGRCMDCNSEERICGVTTVMHKKPLSTDVHIIVVGEALGY